MTLDKLYEKVKGATYPINDRDKLQEVIGEERIEFCNSTLDGKNIALAIEKYPIHSAADLIKFFIEGCEEYNAEEGKELNDTLK